MASSPRRAATVGLVPSNSLTGHSLAIGACPGVIDAMEREDGWLMRVRLPGGRISSAQLRVVAGVASEHASGEATITSRLNLQLRAIAPADLEPAATALVGAGLSRADPGGDLRRAVAASPLAGHDRAELIDVTPVLEKVLDGLARADLEGLTPKFGVVIDGGGSPSLRSMAAVVGIGAVRVAGLLRWQVSVGRALDAERTAARLLPAATSPCDVADAVLALTQAHAAANGADATAELLDELADGRVPIGRSPRRVGVGSADHHDPDRINLLAGAFLGRLPSSSLLALADLLDAHPGTELRLAPGPGLALVGLDRPHAATVTGALEELGLWLDPNDPRHGVTACVGKPGCASSRADTSTAAHDIVAHRFVSRPRPAPVHLSGCEKGCGAPPDTEVLVADEHGTFGSLGNGSSRP